jgi:hypothetical protein
MHTFIWEKKASFYKLIIYNTLYRAVWRAVEIQARIRHPGIKDYGKGGFDPWRLYRCVPYWYKLYDVSKIMYICIDPSV